MYVLDLIKSRRTLLGMGQVELAVDSGVSLPTIQNIEANQANPSFSTLIALGHALGFKVKLEETPFDWDRLCGYGLAVVKTKEEKGKVLGRPSPVRTLSELKKLLAWACIDLKKQRKAPHVHRMFEATLALVLAIQCYFPKLYKKHFIKMTALRELFPDSLAKPQNPPLSSRLIKLKNYSGSVLATYL